MPRMPGNMVGTRDSAKGENRSGKSTTQVVKLPPPVQIPKPASQKAQK